MTFNGGFRVVVRATGAYQELGRFEYLDIFSSMVVKLQVCVLQPRFIVNPTFCFKQNQHCSNLLNTLKILTEIPSRMLTMTRNAIRLGSYVHTKSTFEHSLLRVLLKETEFCETKTFNSYVDVTKFILYVTLAPPVCHQGQSGFESGVTCIQIGHAKYISAGHALSFIGKP